MMLDEGNPGNEDGAPIDALRTMSLKPYKP